MTILPTPRALSATILYSRSIALARGFEGNDMVLSELSLLTLEMISVGTNIRSLPSIFGRMIVGYRSTLEIEPKGRNVNAIWYVIGGIIVIVAGLVIFRDKVRGRPVPDAIRPGQALPEFTAVNEKGQSQHSELLRDKPSVLLFVRGSWCPFCSKQVANLTRYYKEITNSGARLILITPNPLETTRRVADFFEVDFEFWLDDSLAIGRKLGLVQTGGVPEDRRSEYGDDTLWPTSLVVDADGIIRHTELSRFIADRPKPEKLLSVVKRLQGLPA